MIEIMKNLASLIKVKTIVTMVMIIVYSVLALRGIIDAANVITLTSMVIAFYFGTQHEKKKPAEALPEESEAE